MNTESSRISTLPSELVIEILQLLDFLSVLRIRLTCRRLCELSTARPIWINLFEECKNRTSVPITLEKPLDTRPRILNASCWWRKVRKWVGVQAMVVPVASASSLWRHFTVIPKTVTNTHTWSLGVVGYLYSRLRARYHDMISTWPTTARGKFWCPITQGLPHTT
ncbi:hypothetical protein CPC08DRAFT_528085 [Agrocybe pediades]|nr:hypothetical protein CPC08DRAFT_528085 [Agrocybe pediades]